MTAQKPRLWMHVGPAKTGTKTIQFTLDRYREVLAGQGVLYPVAPPSNPHTKFKRHHQHFLARAMQAGDAGLVTGYLDRLTPLDDTIISSEGFMNVDPEATLRLAEIVNQRFDCRVLYYVRNPVERANSRAQQSIKTGGTFHERISEMRDSTLSIRRPLEKLAEAYGEDRLVVRKFARDAFVENDLVVDFCHGIERPDLPALMPDRSSQNSSMTMETARNILRYRKETGDSRMIRQDDSRFAEGSTKYALPEEVQRFVWEASEEDRDWLGQTYGIRFDPPAFLRAEPSAQ
jgi:hypothetical protein